MLKKKYLKPEAEYIDFYSEDIATDNWGENDNTGELSSEFGFEDMEPGDD